MNLDCTLDLNEISGCFELSERGVQDANGFWTSVPIVDRSIDDGTLSIVLRDSSVSLSVSAHHIENKETLRAFHAVLDWKLSWQEIVRLHDFLGLILKWQNNEPMLATNEGE